ncbi:MAG: hypothetical protein KAT90_10365 [Gammaproteobacteria bacterium]|nr:hypothetical protein [Gammaproteobacteria bacterium]
MNNRKIIERVCAEQHLTIESLIFNRDSIPTPGGYATGGQWMLDVSHIEGNSHFVGDANDVIAEIEEFWEIPELPQV